MSNQVARNSISNYVSKNVNLYTLSAADPVLTGVTHDVDFDTVVDKLDGALEYDDALKLWTTTVAGFWILMATVRFDANATGSRTLTLDINTIPFGSIRTNATVAGNTILSTYHAAYLPVGNKISVRVIQDSGVTLNLTELNSTFTAVYMK